MPREGRRRRVVELEQNLKSATHGPARALAHFALAVFHDNNGREAAAIPHYRSAIRLGLRENPAAQAHAWLASSYWKVGRPDRALKTIQRSRELRMPGDLRAWIERLEGRVRRMPDRFS